MYSRGNLDVLLGLQVLHGDHLVHLVQEGRRTLEDGEVVLHLLQGGGVMVGEYLQGYLEYRVGGRR